MHDVTEGTTRHARADLSVALSLPSSGSAVADMSEVAGRAWAPSTPARWQLVAKRAVDIVVATAALLLTLPVLIVLAVAVRVSSPGPVLFRQTRVGRDGRPFSMLKFRTFPVGHVPPREVETTDVAVVPVARSPLRVGHFLRQSSLDELPQLVNVLLGHMSLVGPRPERPEIASQLAARIPGYRDRERLPVGMTGHAQVLGVCGDTAIEDRVCADNLYIDGWNVRGDLRILVRTVPTLLRKLRT